MNTRKTMGTTAALGATMLASTAMAAGDGTVDELRAELAAMKGRITDLESQNARLMAGEDWVSEQRAAEVRSLVADALADADGRSSLLQSGGAGWSSGGGFQIADPSGAFSLRVKGAIQYRWVGSFQDNSGGDDTTNGFELSRTRFGFSGNVVDDSWSYNIWTGYGNVAQNVLLEAYIKKQLNENWSLTAGQFKLPTWQEWTVSEMKQQFVERSVLDSRFAQSYSQGLMATYQDDALRVRLAYSDGLRSLNSAYNGPAGTFAGYNLQNDWALTARVDYKLEGDWSNYTDYRSTPDSDPLYVVGGGIHLQSGESGTAANEVQVMELNLDTTLKFGGWSLFGGFVYRQLDDDAMLDRDEMGFLVQGGYFIQDDLELIARYEYGDLDGAGVTTDDLNIITFGVTKYWNGHGLKWTTDVGYALDEIDATWGATSAGRGFRADGAGEDGQLVLRSQLQLVF